MHSGCPLVHPLFLSYFCFVVPDFGTVLSYFCIVKTIKEE